MNEDIASIFDDIFTPSEIVLINEKSFVDLFESNINTLFERQSEFSKDLEFELSSAFQDEIVSRFFQREIYLLDKKTKIDVIELSAVIIIVAILANVWAGTIKLKIKQEKILFFSTTDLYAISTQNHFNWHNHSLENFIPKQIKQQKSIKWIVFNWIEQDRNFFRPVNEYAPWKSVVELVKKGMAQRNLLEIISQKSLWKLPYIDYKITKLELFLSTQNLVQPIIEKLQKYKNNNPDIWSLLLKEIKTGARKHVED